MVKRLFFSFYGQMLLWSLAFLLKSIYFYDAHQYPMNWKVILGTMAVYWGGLLAVNSGGKYRVWRTAAWALLWGVVLWVNGLHLQVFQDLFSIMIIKQAMYLGQIGSGIAELIQVEHLVYVLEIPLLILLWRFAGEQTEAVVKVIRLQLVVCVLLAFGLPILLSGGLLHLLIIRYSNPFIVHHIGLPAYAIYDAAYALKMTFANSKLSSEQQDELERYFREKRQAEDELMRTALAFRNGEQQDNGGAHNESAVSGMFRGKNLILLQIESLQRFVVGRQVQGQAVTPVLNRLAENGWFFDHIYDQTGSGRTTDAEMAALRSVFPARFNGSIYVNFPQNQYLSLPRLMQQEGYHPVSAHAYSSSFYNRVYAHPNLGFESTWFSHDFRNTEQFSWGLADASFYEQMSERIAQLRKPYFSFLISLSNHSPYKTSKDERIRMKLTGEWADSKQGGYLQSVRYTDWAIGQLIEHLRAKDLMKDTVLIIYGDHDAGFSAEELEWFLEDGQDVRELDRVPLIIYSECEDAPTDQRLITVSGGQLDIAPTVLELFGIDRGDSYFLGQSLVSGAESRRVFFRDGSYRGPDGFVDCKEKLDEYCENGKQMLQISDWMLESGLDSDRLKRDVK